MTTSEVLRALIARWCRRRRKNVAVAQRKLSEAEANLIHAQQQYADAMSELRKVSGS